MSIGQTRAPSWEDGRSSFRGTAKTEAALSPRLRHLTGLEAQGRG